MIKIFFLWLSTMAPCFVWADASALAYENLRKNCIENSSGWACHAPNPLQQMIKQSCEQRRAEYHCEDQQQRSSPENKKKFFSCQDADEICDSIASGTSSRLYSCGESIGGVLVNAAKQMALLPLKLFRIAVDAPNQPRMFEKCYENLNAKKAYLGTFRPDGLTDETLSRMDCSDLQQYAQMRQEVILSKLEDRRQQEATRRHRNTLSNAELKLTDAEIQALQFDPGHRRHFKPLTNPCYSIAENVKASCALLSEIYLSAAGATMLSGNLTRIFREPADELTPAIVENPKGPIFPSPEHIGTRLIFKTKKDFPPVEKGFVRIYRSTGKPKVTQLSPRQRDLAAKNPDHQAPRGDESFLSDSEGHDHAFGENNPDGISVTTDFDTAMNVPSPTVLVYDIPKDVFNQLPRGEPLLGERVFKDSIPDEYVKGVFVKPVLEH